jgi:hypothetical protein
MALRNDFVPRLIDCMRPTGRPRKIVSPATAPKKTICPELM